MECPCDQCQLNYNKKEYYKAELIALQQYCQTLFNTHKILLRQYEKLKFISHKTDERKAEEQQSREEASERRLHTEAGCDTDCGIQTTPSETRSNVRK